MGNEVKTENDNYEMPRRQSQSLSIARKTLRDDAEVIDKLCRFFCPTKQIWHEQRSALANALNLPEEVIDGLKNGKAWLKESYISALVIKVGEKRHDKDQTLETLIQRLEAAIPETLGDLNEDQKEEILALETKAVKSDPNSILNTCFSPRSGVVYFAQDDLALTEPFVPGTSLEVSVGHSGIKKITRSIEADLTISIK